MSQASELIKNRVAYVMQDDVMMGTQTPREILEFAATLKTGSTKHVDEVLQALNLKSCENTRVGKTGEKRGISGGERKRTAIAEEMLTKPSVLFLDEPTSGLDSSNALHVVQIMKELASAGRTVVATIHQPSSDIFYTFDQIILLSMGRIVYCGPPDEVVDYFRDSLGFKCPRHSNPADFLLNVTHIDFSESRADNEQKVDSWSKCWKETKIHKKLKKDKPIKENLKSAKFERHVPGVVLQFRTLLKRALTDYLREPMKIRANFGKDLILSILLGLIFLQLDLDQASINSRSGGMFFFCVAALMSSVVASTNTFPGEKVLFFREHANHMYSTTIYYLAKICSDFPFATFISVVSSTIFYWMAGLVTSGENYIIFVVALWLLTQIGNAWGLFLGTVAKDSTVAITLVPLTVMPFLIFSGFLLNSSSTPVYFIWVEPISYMSYGFKTIMKNEYQDLKFTCTASETIQLAGNLTRCPIVDGEQYLSVLEMNDVSVGENLAIMAAFCIGMRIISYIALKVLAKKHKANA